MNRNVIDVSYHNGVIDWEKVKAAGVEGAILRCGYGMDQTDQDDKQFKRNADECTRLGIPFGVYLYSLSLIHISVTSNYKEQYLEYYHSNKTKAAELKSKLIGWYMALGDTREQAAKKIDKWPEQEAEKQEEDE